MLKIITGLSDSIAQAERSVLRLIALALPLMLWPRRVRTKIPRAVAYGAYPAHLALIWLAKEYL